MMIPLLYASFLGVLVGYGAATLLYWRGLLKEDGSGAGRAPLARNIGMGFHVVFLLLLGIKYQELPLVHVANLLTALALSLVLIHTVIEVLSSASGTGAFILGMATLLHLLGWTSIQIQPEELNELLRSPMFGVHVVFAVWGYTGFILSALYGLMYLIQFRALKSMRFGPLFKNLPALDFLGRMNIVGATVGLACLTVAIVMGVLLAVRLPDFSPTDAKFIQAFAAWLVYLVLVAMRYAFGWTGKRLVYLSLASFALFVGSVLVVSTFFQSFHQFS